MQSFDDAQPITRPMRDRSAAANRVYQAPSAVIGVAEWPATVPFPATFPGAPDALHLWQPILEELQSRRFQTPATPLWLRAVESAIAALCLVLSLPVMAALAAIVCWDSPGPPLFRHWRVGKNGRLFKFTKFRTLYVDAKERWPELYAYRYTPDELKDLRFKISNDPRVTNVGRWLRKSTIDELPNLWHVLTGEMALVGPRPEIPEMRPYYSESALRKFSVRPGVTGLAQVSGRGVLTFRQTVRYDVQYVEQRSVRLDIKILAQTIYRTLRRDGAF
jgi:lipopolysaccharide/colanic/teichoic acid biosynthesis glycosyltransferase